MMNKTLKGFFGTVLQCLCQSTHGQIASYAPAQLPADALSAVEIQDNREKDMLMLQLDMVQSRDFPAF
jgi:hypothetical protein